MKNLKKFEAFSSFNPTEHDVVILNDNRVGTIVHVYPDGINYVIEIDNDTEQINQSQIKEIL